MAVVTEPVSGRSASPVRPRPKRRPPSPGRILATTVALFLAVVWLLPLLWALDTSLKPEAETTAIPLRWLPSEFTAEAYGKVLKTSDLLVWFFNSTVVSVTVTLLTLLLCSLAGFGFSRTRFRGRGVLFAVVLAGIMVPPQVLIIPLFSEMQSLNLVDTLPGIILPQLVAPAMVFIMKKFYDAMPVELEEAARVDGASRLRIWWNIAVPLSRNALLAVGIFTFIHAWNNFLWPFVVTTDPENMTIPVGLATVQSSYGVIYAQLMALALLGGLPLLVVFVLFQRQVVRGIAQTGLKG
jgi:multiple sugar transport system permease protein